MRITGPRQATKERPKDLRLEHRDRLEQMLRRYLRTLYVTTGLLWSEDNDSEIAAMVDHLDNMVQVAVRQELRAAFVALKPGLIDQLIAGGRADGSTP